MNKIYGMSIKQFNDVLEEMRQIYKFDDNETYIGELRDSITNHQNNVEIITKDPATGIQIIMSKGVNHGEEVN